MDKNVKKYSKKLGGNKVKYEEPTITIVVTDKNNIVITSDLIGTGQSGSGGSSDFGF